MDLTDFIKKHGDTFCAALFGVKERTVASWRRRENYPRAKKASEIVIKTGGLVTYDGIFSKQGCCDGLTVPRPDLYPNPTDALPKGE